MDNSKPDLPESEYESQPAPQAKSEPVETETISYVNEHIKKAFDRVKLFFKDAKNYFNRSPRLQKFSHQGKYLPAFWTVASIFSLIVNIILIAILISFGRNFFMLKALVADGLINGTSSSLALMDKAHIVITIPVSTTVQLKDDLPLVYDLTLDQYSDLTVVRDTTIQGARIYLNNTAVTTDLTLPANTPIQVNMDMTIPVSTTVPVNITVPVAIQVPIDIPVEQTDLHQSIVGLQGALEPYRILMDTLFTSPKDIPLCNYWWSGWMCSLFFGKR
jgi:hypothetical protein